MTTEENLAEYSRGRADAETQHKDDIQALIRFLKKLYEDADRLEKDYVAKKDIYNKIMRTYYGAKKSAFMEILERLKWEFGFELEECLE